jgi:hypothetical protein
VNDRISLVNEDMRIFPRCLDNPAERTRHRGRSRKRLRQNLMQSWMIRALSMRPGG